MEGEKVREEQEESEKRLEWKELTHLHCVDVLV